jgi:recombination protein RecA
VVKNKVAPPFKVAEFDIMYNEGISKVGGILDLGVGMELITKRGSFYSYGDLRLGQGRENVKGYLRDNPELSQELEAGIRTAAGLDDETKLDDILEEDSSDERPGEDPEDPTMMDIKMTETAKTVSTVGL